MERNFGIDLKELKKNYTSPNFKLDSSSYFKESAKFLTKYTLSVISDDIKSDIKSEGTSSDKEPELENKFDPNNKEMLET